jgi:hypothetical protein
MPAPMMMACFPNDFSIANSLGRNEREKGQQKRENAAARNVRGLKKVRIVRHQTIKGGEP